MPNFPDNIEAKNDEETETLPPAPAEEQSAALVSVTVTKFGEDKVSTGQHIAGTGDVYAKRGEKMMVSKSVADALEERGLAETD